MYGQDDDDVAPAAARQAPEDPGVDLLQGVGVLLLDERLHRGEEGRHRDSASTSVAASRSRPAERLTA